MGVGQGRECMMCCRESGYGRDGGKEVRRCDPLGTGGVDSGGGSG